MNNKNIYKRIKKLSRFILSIANLLGNIKRMLINFLELVEIFNKIISIFM